MDTLRRCPYNHATGFRQVPSRVPWNTNQLRQDDHSAPAAANAADPRPSANSEAIATLEAVARVLRRHIVDMTYQAQSGHPGGSLSAIDMVAALYFGELRHRPDDPAWPDRDRFILSKGHCCPALYAALAQSGYFPVEELQTYRKLNSRIQGHASVKTPGVEMSSGSLGQGLSFGVGTALALRLDGNDARIFVMMGDGELDEGQVWEAAMAAKHYGLGNIVALIDRNGIQNDRATKDVLDLEPIEEKWRAFGWRTEVIDGHSMPAVVAALDRAVAHDGPAAIVADTVKGKGVSFMEGNPDFHGKAPNDEQYEQAMKELAG